MARVWRMAWIGGFLFLGISCNYSNYGELVTVKLTAKSEAQGKRPSIINRAATLNPEDNKYMHSMTGFYTHDKPISYSPANIRGSLELSVESGFKYRFAVLGYTAKVSGSGSCNVKSDLIPRTTTITKSHELCDYYYGESESFFVAGPVTIPITIYPETGGLNLVTPMHIRLCSNGSCSEDQCEDPGNEGNISEAVLEGFSGSMRLPPVNVWNHGSFDQLETIHPLIGKLYGEFSTTRYKILLKISGEYYEKGSFIAPLTSDTDIYICNVNYEAQ